MYVHIPVLIEPVLEMLEPGRKKSLLVDATLGEGGHAAAFLAKYANLSVYGVEADERIIQIARERLQPFGKRVRFCHRNFSDFFEEGTLDRSPDRIFFDLGISMYHYQESHRGFSFQRDESLDMRIDTSHGPTAADIVNSAAETELRELLRHFGEERFAAGIARAIVQNRKREPILRSKHLAQIVRQAVPPSYRHARLHPATKTFQALRIEVNQELDNLKRGLQAAFNCLKPGGRLGVISFHSLEDRIVKHFFQEGNKSCTCPPDWPICQCGGQKKLQLVNRKPISALAEEANRNPASRSAKLRVVEKLV